MLEIRESKIGGKGVFTLDKIKKNQRVFKFADKIIPINHRLGCHCKVCCRCINLNDNLWLYPDDNSFGWNLNHSCNPNCFSKRKFIYALKNIKPNEEITIDYSTTNIDKRWKMKCHCKSSNCRKIIRSVQYLSKRLFNKYKNYMQPFIRNNY
jgi:hypothetical protein